MNPYRTEYVEIDAATLYREEVVEEAWRICKERVITLSGEEPSTWWSRDAWYVWNERRYHLALTMVPSKYDYIEAANRIRDGRSVTLDSGFGSKNF